MDNSVKGKIRRLLTQVIQKREELRSQSEPLKNLVISRPKKKEWGDLSTNLPFVLSRQTHLSNHQVGQILREELQSCRLFSRVEFVSPGFLNFFLSSSYLQETLKRIVAEKGEFTRFSLGENRKIQVEFVSANPTGPLHIGHGRAAAFGDSMANILDKVGYQVEREYLVNDVGGQIQRLARSVIARLRELEGKSFELPEDGYQGAYLVDIAGKLREKLGKQLSQEKDEKSLLKMVANFTVEEILGWIREDLREFGVSFDLWFCESELHRSNELLQAISYLKEKGYTYMKDGALWFKTSSILEAEKDRVLRRSNGEYTYFASDVAYHLNKLKRGFYQVIDIWGADHIGYVPRMKAVAQALGYPPGALRMIIYQLVTLKRGGQRVSASTRSGEFIPLKQVVREVGKDAARFFFISRTGDSHLDFDLDLAKKQTPENPVFYIQYAHARICSIMKKAREKGIELDNLLGANLDLLRTSEEKTLMVQLALLPDQIKEAAENLEPHHLAGFLEEMAGQFHYFYTRHRVISENKDLTLARLFLVEAVQIAIADVFRILGISAPQEM